MSTESKTVAMQSIGYHLVDECNLACQFCTHYSNLRPPKNHISCEAAKREWETWSRRIVPGEVRLLGGEPTLHPQLVELVELAKATWTKSRIRLYSNGLLLDKFRELPASLAGHMLTVSLHFDEATNDRLRQKTVAFLAAGVDVSFNESIDDRWLSFYQLDDAGKPIPFNHGNQRQSWEICPAKRCHILRNGKLYKCPQVAFHDTIGLQWPGFVEYDACGVDDDITEWLAREDEACCAHCPSTLQVVREREGRKYHTFQQWNGKPVDSEESK